MTGVGFGRRRSRGGGHDDGDRRDGRGEPVEGVVAGNPRRSGVRRRSRPMAARAEYWCEPAVGEMVQVPPVPGPEIVHATALVATSRTVTVLPASRVTAKLIVRFALSVGRRSASRARRSRPRGAADGRRGRMFIRRRRCRRSRSRGRAVRHQSVHPVSMGTASGHCRPARPSCTAWGPRCRPDRARSTYRHRCC